jgi:hypothetical protein
MRTEIFLKNDRIRIERMICNTLVTRLSFSDVEEMKRKFPRLWHGSNLQFMPLGETIQQVDQTELLLCELPKRDPF